MRIGIVFGIVFALALLALFVHAQNGTLIALSSQGAEVSRFSVPAPIWAGSFPAWIADKNLNPRTELYLGEEFYVVFDLRQFQGPLYVVITLDDGSQIVGLAEGGYIYGYPMRIVEPIFEGKTYRFIIEVYTLTGRYLGSAAVEYVEKYCPDFEIESVNWDRFVAGRIANVSIVLRNKGEATWTYRVEIWSKNGGLEKTSRDVTVGANSTAQIVLPVLATSYQKTDQMIVRVSCAGGKKYNDWTYQISVLPPRPGPIVISAQPIEAKLGQSDVFAITLRNLGYDAEIESITLSEGEYQVDAPKELAEGSEADAIIHFTPTRAGVYNITLKVRYKSPITGEQYEDTATITARVYALLKVTAVDHMGRPVAVDVRIAGSETAEAWLLPGRYVVEVPATVNLSEGERLVFAGWSAGGSSPTVEVELRENTELTAVYNRMYKVVVDLSPALPPVERWVREGDVFTYDVPKYVQISEDARWALDGFVIGGKKVESINLVVEGPTVITSVWHKEYKVTLGYKILTAEGVEAALVVERLWVPAGEVLKINAEELKPPESAGVRYELAGFEKDGVAISGEFTVTGPHDVYVLWDKYYLVKVETPVGSASGGGWYKAGTYATISLNTTTSGFLVYDRFKKWVADDGQEFQSPSITIRVDRPIVLTAVWEKDYTQAIALAGGAAVSGLAYTKRETIWRTITKTRSRTRRVELEELDKTLTWSDREKEKHEG